MNFIDGINKSTLIICSNADAKRLLHHFNEQNKLYDIKLMSLAEVKQHLYFTYDEKSIYYLMKNYNMKYEVAQMYLENLNYISEKIGKFSKIDKLIKYKAELDAHNLLIYDALFKDYLKTKEVIIFNYPKTKELEKLVENIRQFTKVSFADIEPLKYQHQVYEFDTLEEEVQYVAHAVATLIDNGVDINKIKLTNLNNDYTATIKKIFNFYNIKINLLIDESIYGTEIVRAFLEHYESDIKKTIAQIECYKDSDIYRSIVAICNKYMWCGDYLEIKDMIIHDLKSTKVKDAKYDRALEVIDYKTAFISDDTHVFMLNFNEGSIPVIHKDEEYLSDKIKEALKLDTSSDKNIIETNEVLKKIGSIKNLVITYKLKTPFRSFYPSLLIDSFEVIKEHKHDATSYSSINEQINLAKGYDQLLKYGLLSDELRLLNSNYDIDYRTYDHRYKKINQGVLKEFLNNKLYLSYSAMDNYNKCAFKYYISNVLKLDIYKDTLATKIGLLFHHVLEVGLKDEINVSEEVDNYCKTMELNAKEKFFIDKLKGELDYIIKTIKKQMTNCHFDQTLYEERVVVNKERNIKVQFTGFIDKILYKEEEKYTLVALVDYKTGNTDIDLQYFPYGLGLQLPIYLYLAKNSKLSNIKFAGFYLQKILNPPKLIDHSKPDDDSKEKSLKLHGYSTSDITVLREFDESYENSEVIQSLKVKADGTFYANAKILSEKQIETLIDLTDRQIDNCIDNIVAADFKINPKKDQKNIACLYCNFKDICYMKDSDCEVISGDKELTFLGGENHD